MKLRSEIMDDENLMSELFAFYSKIPKNLNVKVDVKHFVSSSFKNKESFRSLLTLISNNPVRKNAMQHVGVYNCAEDIFNSIEERFDNFLECGTEDDFKGNRGVLSPAESYRKFVEEESVKFRISTVLLYIIGYVLSLSVGEVKRIIAENPSEALFRVIKRKTRYYDLIISGMDENDCVGKMRCLCEKAFAERFKSCSPIKSVLLDSPESFKYINKKYIHIVSGDIFAYFEKNGFWSKEYVNNTALCSLIKYIRMDNAKVIRRNKKKETDKFNKGSKARKDGILKILKTRADPISAKELADILKKHGYLFFSDYFDDYGELKKQQYIFQKLSRDIKELRETGYDITRSPYKLID